MGGGPLKVSDYVEGVLQGDRAIMGRAITLVESNSPAHQRMAEDLLGALKSKACDSTRVAITGVPGVGKSTFIESFGSHLTDLGRRVAVLAIDPSSTITGGSILGDKTRMERLGRDDRCFIRPSPTGGTLGGVGRSTMETIVICEAAGFDVILVETVGVGQSEVTARNLVDFFVLLLLPNAGDSLQGIKRGIMELSDCLAVNKADGGHEIEAQVAKGEYEQALAFMRPSTMGWKTPVLTCSALDESGIDEVWKTCELFVSTARGNGAFQERRKDQLRDWFAGRLEQSVRSAFLEKPEVKAAVSRLQREFQEDVVTLGDALREILRTGGL